MSNGSYGSTTAVASMRDLEARLALEREPHTVSKASIGASHNEKHHHYIKFSRAGIKKPHTEYIPGCPRGHHSHNPQVLRVLTV